MDVRCLTIGIILTCYSAMGDEITIPFDNIDIHFNDNISSQFLACICEKMVCESQTKNITTILYEVVSISQDNMDRFDSTDVTFSCVLDETSCLRCIQTDPSFIHTSGRHWCSADLNTSGVSCPVVRIANLTREIDGPGFSCEGPSDIFDIFTTPTPATAYPDALLSRSHAVLTSAKPGSTSETPSPIAADETVQHYMNVLVVVTEVISTLVLLAMLLVGVVYLSVFSKRRSQQDQKHDDH
ncbi:hypothetical protein Btru_055684 [Bulinus truncatus]|nr:hypothetical protein Btru_055684 [Bulinus truncatus]